MVDYFDLISNNRKKISLSLIYQYLNSPKTSPFEKALQRNLTNQLLTVVVGSTSIPIRTCSFTQVKFSLHLNHMIIQDLEIATCSNVDPYLIDIFNMYNLGSYQSFGICCLKQWVVSISIYCNYDFLHQILLTRLYWNS